MHDQIILEEHPNPIFIGAEIIYDYHKKLRISESKALATGSSWKLR